MHKKILINRLRPILLILLFVVVSFLAGYMYALKVVGDDKQKEFNAIERHINNVN